MLFCPTTFGAVHFDIFSKIKAERTLEFAKECEKIRCFLGLKSYGGHYEGITCFSKLVQFDLYSVTNQDDPMHDIDGIIKNLHNLIPNEIKEKLPKLDKYIKLTKETMNRFG